MPKKEMKGFLSSLMALWPTFEEVTDTPVPEQPPADPDKKPKEDKYRARHYCSVLYPDDETHVACMEKLVTDGYRFAAILHDRDVYEDGPHKGEIKKPHWHVVLRFGNAVWNTALAKELGILNNYLQKCGSVDGALLYLVHFGYENTKAQYDVSEVFGPMQSNLITLLTSEDEGERALSLVDIINNHEGRLSYTTLIRKAVEAGLYADLRRMGQFAIGMMHEHNHEWHNVEANARARQDAENFRDFEDFTSATKPGLPLE